MVLMRSFYTLEHSVYIPQRIIRAGIVPPMKPHELIAALMADAGLGAMPLARRMGRPNLQPPIHRFINGEVASPKRSTAEPIAAFFNLPVDALYDERVATDIARKRGLLNTRPASKELSLPGPSLPKEHASGFSEDHPLSDSSITIPPIPMRWGDMTMNKIKEVFLVELADDAMGPEFPSGTVIKFDPKRTPVYGNRVLIRDLTGTFHFRQFVQPDVGEWEGRPTNAAFKNIRPERDGAQVVAVKIGHYVEST